ncbi:MAG TPA: FAD:protein FMN transferase [Terriglobales bacterium]|jgi:thiamine biosynthesis lipoprotein|nr:FAD:protein FMN transferase [Terriglobales bacterium]
MDRSFAPLLVALPAAAVAASLPAAAQIFATETQALEAVVGRDATITRQEHKITPEDRRKLEESTGLRFPEPACTFFVAQRQGQVTGYALVMNEIGKSEPITFMVGMSPEGKVTSVVIMVFRESRGGEVKERRFTQQFQGKRLADPIRVNQDIMNYTGATLSSKAVARGVKRALALLEHFYPSSTRHKAPLRGALVIPDLPRSLSETAGYRLHRQMQCLMGTLCEIRLWAESARHATAALAEGFAELRRIERVFSWYRDDSELTEVNRRASRRPLTVSAEFWQLTLEGLRHYRRSQGAFDVTTAPLSRLWGFRDDRPRTPSPAELAECLKGVGSDKLILDRRRRTIAFRVPGMELDFGGLAKGYAAERAVRVLAGSGIPSALVNLGSSSLYASPVNQLARRRLGAFSPWVVSVTALPQQQASAITFLLDHGRAVSTSGTYAKQFQMGDRLVSHLINPRTGRPVEGMHSATVITRRACDAEALSKQLLFISCNKLRLPASFAAADWILQHDSDGPHAREHLRQTIILVSTDDTQLT